MEEDASGLTFQEWTDVDTSRSPVVMLIDDTVYALNGTKLLWTVADV